MYFAPRRCLGVAAAIVLGLAGVAATATFQGEPEDRLVLKSGRELVGRLEGEHDHVIDFVDRAAGRVTLARRHVRTVVRGDEEPDLFAPIVLEQDASEPPASWMKFDAPANGAAGHLSTGVGRYFHEPTRTTVFLVGAVHIGEAGYFSRLQDVLDSCDVVLFEGVGRDDDGPAPTEDEIASIAAVTKLQILLKDALGLEFQSDGLDYQRAFWKNADVGFATLSRRMKSEGVALPTDSPIFRALLQVLVGAIDPSQAGANPAMRRLLRRQVASALALSESILVKSFQKLDEVLIDWRNDAALKVLDGEIAQGRKGRWIAVFYGAAHLSDMSEKLLLRGLEFQLAGWIPAWTIE